MLTVSDRGI